jgi:hypothetical protein
MKCPNCGASIYDDINRCQYCGSYISSNQHTSSAQQPVVVNVYPQAQPQQETVVHHIYQSETHCSPKSRLVALLLCFFFGGFGFHKFYLGRVGMGILYLFTLGLCGIGVLVDLLVLLLGSPRDSQGMLLTWH